jgi:hypothetical protein
MSLFMPPVSSNAIETVARQNDKTGSATVLHHHKPGASVEWADADRLAELTHLG